MNYNPNMYKKAEILNLLANGLEMDAAELDESSTRENTDAWDSVAHLSFLGLLEDRFPGILDSYSELAKAKSVEEIFTTLTVL